MVYSLASRGEMQILDCEISAKSLVRAARSDPSCARATLKDGGRPGGFALPSYTTIRGTTRWMVVCGRFCKS
ncbi:protein of unknown function [Bradyrhizobium vignae]|uniref:Uncharacterized protein n=1 Tax=Bradyrhizobium vignae TaxID=1549949 RepID=A0A2U3Q6M5_9BRAD|nr:protein of unknown function [Bradyrhizobium vignae]